jgi:hypothetical protein
MERTEPRLRTSTPAQLDAGLAGEVDNINAGFDLVDGRHSTGIIDLVVARCKLKIVGAQQCCAPTKHNQKHTEF